MARWARLGEGEAQAEALERVWHRAHQRGTTGAEAGLEGAVELLMRGDDGSGRDRAFEAVEASLVRVGAAPHLLYRVRDIRHLMANWRGDADEASRLSEQQEASDAVLAADPASLPLVFKSLIHRVTTKELRLDFEDVLQAAQKHHGAVRQYGTVTEMLREATGVGGRIAVGAFERTRLWIKAQMTLARALILAGGEEELAAAETIVGGLDEEAMLEKDKTMAACYRVWVVARSLDHTQALERAGGLVETWPDNPFALAFGVRAAADAHVLGGQKIDGPIASILEVAMNAPEGVKYPFDVLWRDVGVLEGSRRGVKAAGRAFRLARAALDANGASPLTAWKEYGLSLSEAAARKPNASPPHPPDGMGVAGATAREAAASYRRASPY